jgi:DNA-binding response OmpR family regulator
MKRGFLLHQEAPSLAEPGAAARPPGVLLIADRGDLCRLLAVSLRAYGYQVLAPRAGGEARSLERQNACPLEDIELVISVSERGPPLISGLDPLAELRAAGCGAPAILISCFADDALRARASRLGVRVVIDKCFDLKDLLAAARGLVRASRGCPEDAAGPAAGKPLLPGCGWTAADPLHTVHYDYAAGTQRPWRT